MASIARGLADGIVAELASVIGLPELRLDATGSAAVALDEVLVTILLDEGESRFVLMSSLGTVDADRSEAMAALLDANLFWLQTAGGTVARDAGTGATVLLRAMALEGLAFSVFEAAIQGFVSTAERLRARLGATPPEPSPVDSVLRDRWQPGMIVG